MSAQPERDKSQVRVEQVSAVDIYPLRHKVLRPGRPFEDCIWLQDDAPTTAHFAAKHNGQIIGIASMANDPRPVDPPNMWRLRGMATDTDWQGQGIGTLVLARCVEYVKCQGGVGIWCNARTSALSFYRNNGFETVGEAFDIDLVGPHYVMVRLL